MNSLSEQSIVLIPARFASTRFPGKPLVKIDEKRTLIEAVYTSVHGFTKNVAVVTDSEKIEECVHSFGGRVVRVDDDVVSGSERIGLALKRFFPQDLNFKYVINVQGDEPLVTADMLKHLVEAQDKNNFDIMTYVKPMVNSLQELTNPNRVKVAYSRETLRAIYFSRSLIPFHRDQKFIDNPNLIEWFLHIGIYSYKRQALEKFLNLPPSQLEILERLEQLRALENGMTIGAVETTRELIGVDTPDDLVRLKEYLRGN